MKIKKTMKWLSGALSFLMLLSAFAVFPAFAAGEGEVTVDPALHVAYCNLSFRDNVYIKYAVAGENPDLQVLVWTSVPTDKAYTYGTQNEVLTTVGTQSINGTTHLVFNYNKLRAMQMTDEVYVRAYDAATDTYGAVNKYSILQYAYSMMGKLGKAAVNDDSLIQLLTDMLEYGAASQLHFNYKTDGLATDTYDLIKVEGATLDADGMTHGLIRSGASVSATAPATNENGHAFLGWRINGEASVVTDQSITVSVMQNTVLAAVYDTPIEIQKVYTRIDAMDNEAADGEYILFGSYPQTAVDDLAITDTLTAHAGDLPTAGNVGSWETYGYYIEGAISNFMWYQDVTLEGETYRGVYFTSYRPNYTSSGSSTGDSYQDNHGYETEVVYWFKFEPIKWRILQEVGGQAMILCDMVLDAQAYQLSTEERIVSEQTVYANNYEQSYIRAWLNDVFYNTAFGTLEQELIQLTTVDNSSATTSESAAGYACGNTTDHIFLISYQDAIDTGLGFDADEYGEDSARKKRNTDYAKAQGCYGNRGYWWLRSPHQNSTDAYHAHYEGYVWNANVNATCYGVVPALWINLE